MTLNTDLTDLSDVTNEAIEAVLGLVGVKTDYWTAARIRTDRSSWAKLVALFARCIQSHYPDMIVDPVTLKARELVSQTPFSPVSDDGPMMEVVKAAIRAGMEMERHQ